MPGAPAASPTGQPVKLPSSLPKDVVSSYAWRGLDGQITTHEYALPVHNRTMQITGRAFMCPEPDCETTAWVFSDNPDEPPKQSCCPHHPVPLVPVALRPEDRDPVGAARGRLLDRVADLANRKAQQQIAAARGRAEAAARAAGQAAVAAGRRTAADMRGHVPSIAASVGTIAVGLSAGAADAEHVSAMLGVGLSTAGMVAAYVVAYMVARGRVKRRRRPLSAKALRRARGVARHCAGGAGAAGVWLTGSSAVGLDPDSMLTWLLVALGALTSWAVNRHHWDELWATRARLRDLTKRRAQMLARLEEEAARRLEAEEAARRAAEEAARLTRGNDPVEVGRRFAARWQEIAASAGVPGNFPTMPQTRVVPEATKKIVATIDGKPTDLGYQFTVACDPGALVTRHGATPPIVAARPWLAAMLGREDDKVSAVDRPDGEPNKALILVTDRIALDQQVKWRGRAGIRRDPDGTIRAFAGRSLTGNDVYQALYVPGQATGGLRVGTIGGGKSASVIVLLLNLLAGGIFPVLHDPKQLIDYADFLGVFPIGVTEEHARLIAHCLNCERMRREAMLSGGIVQDQYGRWRPGNRQWDLGDGPPIHSVWDEFHMLAKDTEVLDSLTTLVRTQRAAAMSTSAITQGGSLKDWSDSTLRGLLSTVGMVLFRVNSMEARLAGYTGELDTSTLPALPGSCLTVQDGIEVTMRSAFVSTQLTDPESVFDQLYDQNRTLTLPAPQLPEATWELWKREGLMDLWELGKGPEGAIRLTSDQNTPDPAPGQLQVNRPLSGGGTPMRAADVILGLLHLQPGLPAGQVYVHQLWHDIGWPDSLPAPTTISRAARSLEDAQGGPMIERRADSTWWLTSAGQVAAPAAADKIRELLRAHGAEDPTKGAGERIGGDAPECVASMVRTAEARAEQAAQIASEVATAAVDTASSKES